MVVVTVLVGSILALCFTVSLVQARSEAKREGRAVVPAMAQRAVAILIQLFV